MLSCVIALGVFESRGQVHPNDCFDEKKVETSGGQSYDQPLQIGYMAGKDHGKHDRKSDFLYTVPEIDGIDGVPRI